VFHASRLKKGLLRLSNKVTVTNINDLQKEKDKQTILLSDTKDKIITEKCRVLEAHHLVEDCPTVDLWYHDAQLLVPNTPVQDKPSGQHHDPSVLNPKLKHMEINYTFHMSEQCHLSRTCTITKGRYKFGNLEVFCLDDNQTSQTGQWIIIPTNLEHEYIDTLYNLHLKISDSRNKFLNKLFQWF
jgi:hypothetical protein